MSRQKKSKPPNHLTTRGTWNRNPYTPMFDEMIESPAYIALSHIAKFVYLIIAKEYKGEYTGKKVVCPYSKMVSYGISKQTIPKRLKELQALGFIRIDSRGGMYKIPNQYTLLDEWSRFETIEAAKQAVKAALDDGG